MSMLAEPRRKSRVGLNPRGELWARDENKFGQKLMEKMGWSKGKGLGKDGQGDTDHITVRQKANTKGMGYKGSDDVWIQHYEGFENVLAALNSENNSAVNSPGNSTLNSNVNSDNDEPKHVSLEACSKKSQARVHYHKFTRGKDLSRFNADEIGCITGAKRAKLLVKIDEEKKFKEQDIGTEEHENGVTTVKGGNIQEYFAKKMMLLKNSGRYPVKTADENSWDGPTENSDDETMYYETTEKRYHEPTENSVVEDDGWYEDNGCHDDSEWGDRNVQKKRKNIADVSEQEMEEYQESNVEDHVENVERKRSKKSKKVVSEFDSEETKDTETNVEDYESECVEYGKKKKKKRKKATADDIPEDNSERTNENECFEELGKKKKKNVAADDVILPDIDDDGEKQKENLCDEEQHGKKKKKKKKKFDLDDVPVPDVDDGDKSNEIECGDDEPKKKKKKKKKKSKHNELD